MTRHYCTYFDQRYLPRAVLLYQSLRRHDPDARLWALCMDDPAYEALTRLSLEGVQAIRLAEFEAGDAELTATKADRSVVEYYFTCTPSLPLWIMGHADVDSVTYLDADLYFFSTPEPVFAELGDASIGIVEHRFPPDQAEALSHGIYNVGLLAFRNDDNGRAALEWWRERCIEWCYDRVEDGKYADQRYLDDWPTRFDGVKVLTHPGANVAPWNLATHHLSVADGVVMSNGRPLVCYHFHAVKEYVRGVYDLNFAAYGVRPDRTVVRRVYRPYLRALQQTTRDLAHMLPSVEPGRGLRPTGMVGPTGVGRYLRAAKGVATRRLVVA